MHVNQQCDVLIIGAGAAGLSLALKLAQQRQVMILSKSSLYGGSTSYAQGGIAAVLDHEHDSAQQHAEDTEIAGAGLCDTKIVEFCVSHGKEEIDWLISQGMPFTQKYTSDEQSTPYHLTKEGGHTKRRVVHADDATGKAVSESLIKQVNDNQNILTYEHFIAIDLIISDKGSEKSKCIGVYVYNQQTQQVEVFSAANTVLATGGASKVYLYTSNPDTSTGDGIAMAWRAGCRVANMEFNQFHPTCLYHPKAKSFLLTEVIRGEGGLLTLKDGQSFMHKFDPREELAPRDIVARAIDYEMKRTGTEHVYLDISHRSDDFIKSHFPNIYERCLKYQIDITKDPIPVVPAAHYTCGGVMTDINGKTDINNLYAIGETAFTGFHGANRMASNSLLECLVFAQATADHILAHGNQSIDQSIRPWDESLVTGSEEEVIVSHNWSELRRVMWDYVGIVRNNKRLNKALKRINLLTYEVDEYYRQYKINPDLIELRNLVQVAQLIIKCAMARKESRGLHYTLDYPYVDDKQYSKNTIMTPKTK
ncbi:MAG: L-aspartate oxidase [Gammaproteobacteria bacterium]|nr:L-aspartate oxidase [Gammaproteobacteria bacterium]